MRSVSRFELLLIIFAIFVAFGLQASAQKLKPEEIVTKHLDSIGSESARSGRKSMIAAGDVRIDYITQKNQSATGRVVIASEARKFFFGLRLNAGDYPQEKIVFDGSTSSVDFVRPGVRSDLGNFVQSNGELVSHSLLGGSLFTSWAFLNLEDVRPKLSSGGLKKIDGAEAYVLRYQPRRGNDLDITVYFDKETFRHIRTEYRRTLSSAIGRTIDDSARQSETRLRVVEDFSDFKEVDGITVPQKYRMLYTFVGSNGTKEVLWSYEFTEFAPNQNLDPGTFALGPR